MVHNCFVNNKFCRWGKHLKGKKIRGGKTVKEKGKIYKEMDLSRMERGFMILDKTPLDTRIYIRLECKLIARNRRKKNIFICDMFN